MDKDFVKAQSDNLPAVSVLMVTEYLQNLNRKEVPESKGVKQMRSCREEYGDAAVGYVQLKRDSEKCVVKGRVCPEHKVTSKAYNVQLIVNEIEDCIESAECFDCAAAKGGCKHSLAFLMWCHRRSEEPSPTSVASYWQKPKLASAIASKEVLKCKDFARKKRKEKKDYDYSNKLFEVIKISKEKNVNSVLYECAMLEPLDALERLSVNYIAFKFCNQTIDKTFKNFLAYSESVMQQNEQLINEVFKRTILQADEPIWYSLRFGRITASLLREASTCKTPDGSLVNRVLGSDNTFCSVWMMRGKKLEPLVLKAASKKLNIKINKCGLKLHPQYPIFGASADGMTDDGKTLVEIKCPSSEAAKTNFVKDGKIRDKVKLQMQLQMLMHGIEKCILCVASPLFETDGELVIISEDFDSCRMKQALFDAQAFYGKILFPKLMEIYSE